MSGEPENVRLWEDADVYWTDNLSAPIPATIDDPFGAEWDLVGLLNGDDGFVTTRNEDVTDHYAWGGILIRTSRRNRKVTRSFTALEWNETTRALAWPGSEPGIVRWGKPVRGLVAWETVDQGIKHRLICAYQAECVVDGDMTENEPDPASVTFVVTVFPNDTGDLFIEQETETGS